MGWFIPLVGLFWTAIGLFGLTATKRLTLALSNLIKNTRRQTLGLASLVIGVLLLISAPFARESWFVVMLGIVACLKGVMTIIMPQQKLKAVLDWWLAAPESIHKWWAALMLILGLVMIVKV